jgi:hypothetical protein
VCAKDSAHSVSDADIELADSISQLNGNGIFLATEPIQRDGWEPAILTADSVGDGSGVVGTRTDYRKEESVVGDVTHPFGVKLKIGL